jgi:hypothetical protein
MLRLPIPLLDALGRGPRHSADAGAHRSAAVCGGYVSGAVSSRELGSEFILKSQILHLTEMYVAG